MSSQERLRMQLYPWTSDWEIWERDDSTGIPSYEPTICFVLSKAFHARCV